MTVGLIIAGIALALFYGIYVSLVKKKNNLKEAAAGIDVQLKKRYDLIPNLLKAAAKYMEHEKDVFMKVTELREKAMNAAGYEERFKAEQQLSEARISADGGKLSRTEVRRGDEQRHAGDGRNRRTYCGGTAFLQFGCQRL